MVLDLNKENLEITQSGDYSLEIKENKELIIYYKADSPLSLSLNIKVDENVKATILFVNSLDCDLETKEEITVKGNLELGYLKTGKGKASMKIRCYLDSEYAYSHLHTATIGNNTTNYDIETIHNYPYTQGIMDNYGIVVNDSLWNIVCAGRILNGCKQSASHQSTRILTFRNPEAVKVLPILYIDENDVEASHATSLGQPDSEELYYMESRGLSKEQAISLLTIGYLLPICKILSDENKQQEISKMIESQVNLWNN